MQWVKWAGATGAALMLSGCMSSKFSCPGMPEGVTCLRPSQVYELTNGSDRLQRGDVTKGKKPSKEQGPGASQPLPDRLLMPLVAPMPVREPPQVMRIWVAPYNDENDDLVYPSYVFTEVKKRRWTVGEQVAAEVPTLTPFQVDTQALGARSQAAGSSPAVSAATEVSTPSGSRPVPAKK